MSIDINLYANLQQSIVGNETNVEDAISVKGVKDAVDAAPVSPDQQAALDLKADQADFSNVDNTSDENKEVSIPQQAALDLKPATVADITTLIAYNGGAQTVIVKDSVRGGTFKFVASGLVNDGGVVFTATGKGSGFWQRIYTESEGVHTKWFGLDLTGATNISTAIQNINIKYDTIVFDEGIYNSSINNTLSNKTYIWKKGAIFAPKFNGGVIHIAIGHGPLNPNWVGGDTVSIVENVRVIGTIQTTSRVGSFYCKNIVIDDIHVFDGSGTYGTPTPFGVHFYYGSQNMSVGTIVAESGVDGDFGLGIDSVGATPYTGIDAVKSISIKAAKLNAVNYGLLIDKCSDINIESVIIESWGDNTSLWNGVKCLGVRNSYLGNIYVDNSQSTNATVPANFFVANDGLRIESLTSVNGAFEGVQVKKDFTDSFFTTPTDNKELSFGRLSITNTAKSGLKITDKVKIDEAYIYDCNTSLDANSANAFFSGADGSIVDYLEVNDSNNITDGIRILNSTNIDILKSVVNGSNVFGYFITDSSFINFGQAKCVGGSVADYGFRITGSNNINFTLASATNCTIYGILISTSSYITFRKFYGQSCPNTFGYNSASSFITVNELQSVTAGTRDVSNAGGTNVSIGFRGGTVFFANPYQEAGFRKLGNDYAAAAPTTGQHYAGHIYYNSAPTAGGKIGFVCVTSGAAGTWKPFGAIDA